jgi:hypothetical protein
MQACNGYTSPFYEKGRNLHLKYFGLFAETGGFEPPIRLPVYTLSRRAPSATRTRLRNSIA